SIYSSERAYKDKFLEWSFTKRQIPLYKNEELVNRVRSFWLRNMSSATMIRCLGQEGWQLSTIQLRNLRLHPSLRLLMGTSNFLEARTKATEEAQLNVQEHLISGQSIRYGRTYTLAHIRRTGVFVSQHQVWNALQVLDLQGIETQGKAIGKSRSRKEFYIQGPNRVISIDGHDKLSRFGFEIYGAIDAYSHYVVWCYVGISNRTAISVNKQYLCFVRSTLHIPQVIRSDKGTETVLLAESHLLLRRSNHPNLSFSHAYSFGKSTKNQRIEAWWNILTEGQTQEWKIYFAQLESEGLFDGSDIDKSCLQFIYMEIIRSHIHNFVEVHNSHSIRKQPKRDHYLPTGKPFEMYFYPLNAENYQESVDETILSTLESEVEAYDLDSYLPMETISLYSTLLLEAQLPTSYSYDNPKHQ
ncbi:hypothetical protein HOY80DRAFT_878747, partial [Tuber brumale]